MLLEIKELNVGYGDIQVLWDINLQIEEGQIVALVGANGAGKSTLLKTVSGLLNPYSGKIIYQEEDITRMPSKEIVARGIIQVPEGRRLFPQMTVEENLMMGAFRRKKSKNIQPEPIAYPPNNDSAFPASRRSPTVWQDTAPGESSRCVPLLEASWEIPD